MFLSRAVRQSPDDSGMALVAVIALAAVTAVIGVTVGAVTVRSLETTNGVAASVEARATAQAGLAFAEKKLRETTVDGDGLCPSGATLDPAEADATGVDFLVEIFSDDGAGGWLPIDGASAVPLEAPTCPTPETVRIKVVSTGFAERSVSGAGEGEDAVSIEATYQYVPRPVTIPIVDPAVYAYSIEGVLKKFVLDSADISIAADLQIKTGNFECSNNARVSGDVILGDGYADLNMCQIFGTLHATQYATLRQSEVAGDLIASGVGVGATANTINLEATSEVDGSVLAGGNVQHASSLIRGNLTAAKNTSTKVVLGSGGNVTGNVQTTGTISGSGTVSGTKTGAVTSLTAPPPAQVPNWTNIPWAVTDDASFQATTWYQQGFTTREVWSGNCTMGSLDPRWIKLGQYLTPTVIDATACTDGVVTRNNLSPNLSLKTDIVFIADKFQFDKLYFESNILSTKRDVYFVVPDNNSNLVPSCEGGAGDIYITNEADIKPSVSAFAYTPCKIKSDRDGWRGQFYGGEVEFNQQAQMTFVPTSPPGIDFAGGVPPVTVVAGSFLGDRISIREVSSGG